MYGAVFVLLVWVAIVLAAGWWAMSRVRRREADGRVSRPLASRAGDLATAVGWGRIPVAVATYLMGVGAILVVCWPLGLLAHAVEGPVDWPTFRWFEARQVPGWSEAWQFLTNIGKPRLTQVLAAAGGIVFAVVWKKRGLRWWVPLAVFSTGYALEKYMQIALQDLVHRGHPPTTLGTYPSGGCARVLIVYGLVIFSIISWRWAKSRRAWVVGTVVLAMLWTIQAYARTYNLEHWVTDVVGGSVFGVIALVTMICCYGVLDNSSRQVKSIESETAREPHGS